MRSSLMFFLLFQFLHEVHAGSYLDSEYTNICSHGSVSHGFMLPEYTERNTLNDVTIFYYDSNMDSKMPCPDWLNSAGQWHWKHMDRWTERNRHFLTLGFQSAVQQFNRTGSLSDHNVYQASGCCYLYPNGTYRTSLTHTFNGKDFISLDVDRKTFVAAVRQADVYKHLRDRDEVDLHVLTHVYKTVCRERIDIFKQDPRVCIRKVPEVKIFEQQKAGFITVTCHVTGFYPRAVKVDWLGPDLQPVDEGVTEVLPNGDDTYQTRKSVIVPGCDSSYSCVVLHSSVPDNITRVWVVEKRSRIAVWTSLACVCLLVIGFGFWSCCRSNDTVS
ncbi:class I histocompatibility antigen, F10 alpha chain-like [Salminus brasiliensis]|uniref:class I histocompatibility antigen, F10 alpha chain-like n=1 Tax=Salminus brasiliensis TaxID=930266 RepID=UPI003B836BB1